MKNKKFINFLDSYSKSREITSINYSAFLSAINTSFYENNLYDPSFIGRVTSQPVIQPFYYKPIDISNTVVFDYSYNFINENNDNVYSIWKSQYMLWQKNHDTTLFNIQPEKIIEKKLITIDASISSLSDIISIINNNEYHSEFEYNIDLKALHNIKLELSMLENMIGMESMKQSIMDQLIYFIQELHLGKETSDFKHTVIYGPPGTGKTEIAKIIGKMYSKLGILKNNIFKKVTRNDLIAGYLGQTAIKTKKVIDECLGGVLFIDEAYSLASGYDNSDSFSKECIDILCEALSDYKGNLMVIVAGYEDELNETFFRVNKGLKSRFIWRFTMEPYSSKELKQIFKKLVIENEWTFEDEETIKDKWFDERKEQFTSFGRDMELLLTYVKIAHGRRIYGKDKEYRKKLSVNDISEGYSIFLKNKKTSKKDMSALYGIYV